MLDQIVDQRAHPQRDTARFGKDREEVHVGRLPTVQNLHQAPLGQIALAQESRQVGNAQGMMLAGIDPQLKPFQFAWDQAAD